MDSRFAEITHLFIDADDTLWHNDFHFRRAEADFAAYVSGKGWGTSDEARALLSIKQEENIPIFGYGSKTYFLGMLDAATQLGGPDFGSEDYYALKSIVERLATHTFEMMDGAAQTVRALAQRYKIVVATKGDLTEQVGKYRKSGLSDCVCGVEVMENKSTADYLNLAAKTNVPPENFVMVGNTVRSDVAPVIEMGGWAIYIPYSVTWEHEVMPLPDSSRIITLSHISELVPILL